MRRFAILLLLLALAAGAVFAQEEGQEDAEETDFTVTLGGNDDLGTFLVDSEGMTLYIFTNDAPGVSNCTEGCAQNWPPLTVEEGTIPTLDPAVSGTLRTIERADGSQQVVYNGQPLYYFANDSEPGDATGQGVGEVWFVATPPQVGLGGNDDLGTFLVGPEGLTLYTFDNDEPGVSNCTGGCAQNWPPLTVESADALTTQPGLVGEFGTIEREDGSLQVTLNEMPLYFWVNDSEPGDATGQGVGDVWFAAELPDVATAETETVGTVLTGANGMTLYTFANDQAGTSNCTEDCAATWPPLTVAQGEAITTTDATTAQFSTIERADGSLQVTQDGQPLYYFIGDVLPGDTNGQGVNDVFFAAQPPDQDSGGGGGY